MILVEELIKLSKEERQKHLELSEPCHERGGNSIMFRGLLAYYLNTTIPKGRILCCHACHNAKCSNPKHLYWGTDKENLEDSFLSGQRERAKPKIKKRKISEKTLTKRINQYNRIPKERGYVMKLARWWGVKHSTARRFIDRHCL